MKKLILGCCCLLAVQMIQAQSYHFSQFSSTPLLTNPAHTGFTGGPSRVSMNLRSQGTPGAVFYTGYLGGDFSLLRDRLSPGYKAGIGAFAMMDGSQNGALKTLSAGISTAYTIGLDAYGDRSIGLGVQATYNQRRLDYSKLSFENQYGPGGYDAALPIGEGLPTDSRSYVDINAGVLYSTTIGEGRSVFGGVSVYNILAQGGAMAGDTFLMPRRFIVQAGGQFSLREYGKLYISLTSMHQAKAMENTIGAAYGVEVSDPELKIELLGGAWLRVGDAIIPYVGYKQGIFQIGFSYDHTVSGLKTSGQSRNAYELTFLFKSPDTRELKTTIPWY